MSNTQPYIGSYGKGNEMMTGNKPYQTIKSTSNRKDAPLSELIILLTPTSLSADFELNDNKTSDSSIPQSYYKPKNRDTKDHSTYELCYLYIERKIGQLLKLENNWDDENSPPIDREIINSVLKLLINLQEQQFFFIPPAVVPISGGSFQFEWRVNDKYLELEFDDPNLILYLAAENGIVNQNAECTIDDLYTIKRLIKWVID